MIIPPTWDTIIIRLLLAGKNCFHYGNNYNYGPSFLIGACRKDHLSPYVRMYIYIRTLRKGHISIIGASVARPPLGVGCQLFYINYIIIMVSWASWIPGYPSRRRGSSAAMKRVWLSAACCWRCRPLPTSYSSTICRSPLSSAARR